MEALNNIGYGVNESSKSVKLFRAMASNDKTQEKKLLLRLHELESINAHLENLVKVGVNKLSEVVTTNAKYLSIIAHDLRSPFASILTVMGVLKDSLKEENTEDTEKYIDLASDSANRTLKLLDDLLPWAISQSKVISFNPVKINLREICISEINSLKIHTEQKHLLLIHSINPDLNVTADLQMVKTILRNLICNAIKFTRSGGKITLSASESKPFVEIVVRDTGTGISEEDQGKLFKTGVFYSTAGTNNEHGTGFGLLLCKEFVELHGGNIWIESEAGQGSKFKFTLPRYI